ncbi:MAG: tandem-95 repeat protein, partial [Planctomycetia bacterium]|nr:tandem-95 repeat protein [Planctomycetia bacterium]
MFAQRFDSSGSKTGSEFQVNTTTTSGQQSPSVATAADGRVVIVWQSNLQDSDAWGIYGQLYSANGQASGSEFQVNNYSTGNQQYPSAAFGPNGGFVVAWNGKGAEDTAGIYAREFDASGNAVAGQFLVNTTTSNTQVAPTVTGTANGYVISWSGDGTADTHGDGVYARRYEISNTTPTSSGIAGVTVNEDANATVIDLFGAFADGQDTDAQLTYTVAANTNPALFGSTVVNATAGTLTLNYAANANGQADVTVRATDTGGLYVETAFHVTVNAVNDVPTSSGIANVTVNEDSAQVTRDLHAAFADVEDSDSQLTYTVTANSNAQLFTAVTIVAASGLLVMDFAPNKNGQAHLTVRGTDSGGLYTETGFDVTVNPVNDQPTTVGIADVTVDEDAQPTVIDLFSAFADIEDTPQQLTYSAYGYSTGGIFISTILSQPNGTLTLNYTPNASGQAGLVVRATDTGGLYRETTFHVTVNPVNDAPTSNGNMTVTVDEDAQPTVVTLFSAFNDIEDTPQQLAYSIVGNTNTGLFNSTPVSQQDGTLTLNYATNANGQADVTVRATDTGGLHVDATIHVTVNAINDVPTTSGIADVTVNEDAQPTVINLLGAFSDVEDTQQQLTYTVVGNSNSGLISSTSVDAQARTLTLAYAANANGQAAVTVRATDTNGSHVDTTFHVTVNSINDTPTTSGIANVVVDEDAQPTLINLLNLFSDVEDSPQQLTYSVIGNSNSDLFTSTTVENQAGSLTLVFAANANGQSDVTVRATDAGGLHVDSMFHVTVNAVNDTPTTVGIADVTVDEDAQPTVIHLQDVFSDVEDTPQQLTYSVVGNTNQGIFASTAIDDQTGILTLAYAANANGEADVTVRATDSGGSHVDTMLRVTVNPINDTPTTSGIADVTVDEDAQPSVINLLAAFSDVEDAQQLTFSVVANTNAGLFSSTTVDAQAGTLTLAYTPNANGESDLTVRATDAGGLHVDTAFHVTVRAINDAPSISGIANVIVDEDAQPTVIHLFDTTSDVEDSPQQLAYSVIGNTNTQLFSSIQVDGQAGTLTLAYASNVNGEADITVRATDAGGLHADTIFHVTVNPVNDGPTASGLASVTVDEDAQPTVVSLLGAFSDVENTSQQLTYSVVANSNSGLFSSTPVSQQNGTLTLNYAANTNGQADFTVRATDTGGLHVDTVLHVTVNPVNDAPSTSGIANVTVDEDAAPTAINLFDAFSDLEDTPQQLTYSIAGVVNSGLLTSHQIDQQTGALTLVYAANANGQTQITVRATDTDGLYVDTSFSVTVNAFNDAPTTSGIAAVTVDEDAQPTEINLFSAFADVENSPQQLTYSIVGNTNGPLFSSTPISQQNGTLTLNYAANSNGQADVTVRATDAGGLHVDTVLHVTVNAVNDQPTTSGLGDVAVMQDASPTVISLLGAFADVEDTSQQLTYTVVGNTNSALFSSTPVSQQNGTLTLNYATGANGQADITVRATDSGGLQVEANLHVTIKPVLYWDPDNNAANNVIGSGAGLGGSGTWSSGSGNNWFNPFTGQDVAWIDGARAVFSTAGGTVTISGTVSADKITVNGGSLTIQSGTLSLPTTSGTSIEVVAGTTTINSTLAGPGGLTKSGAGTLTLSGTNTFTSGVTILNAGVLQLGSAGALNATTPNRVTFGAASTGTLRLAGNSVVLSGLSTVDATSTAGVENASGTLATITVNKTTGTSDTFAGILRNGTGAQVLALTKTGAGTLALSGANTFTGLTTAGGGTLQFSGPTTAPAVSSILVNGGDISIDNGVTLTSRTGNIQFSSNNTIKPTGGSGAMGFAAVNSVYTVTVDAGVTATISAGITGTTTGNVIKRLGSGTLILNGQNNLVADANANLTAFVAVDGGGQLNVTGGVKAASALQSNRTNGISTVGQASSGNALNITGTGQLVAGRLDVGVSTFGNNTVTIASPGTAANPSYSMLGSGAQLNLGVSSSGNSLIVSNGAYVSQSAAGGTNTWTIGANAGANNNSLLITGAGSTVNRTAAAGSAIAVGALGNSNSLTVSAGGLLLPRRLTVGTGTAAG